MKERERPLIPDDPREGITRQLTALREQVASLAARVARGETGLDLLPAVGTVHAALEEVERDLATQQLRTRQQRIGTKHASMGERARRELLAIITILRPWEP